LGDRRKTHDSCALISPLVSVSNKFFEGGPCDSNHDGAEFSLNVFFAYRQAAQLVPQAIPNTGTVANKFFLIFSTA